VRVTPWVSALLIANVVIYFLQMTVRWITAAFAFVPLYAVGRPWTIITYMFLHGGLGHLLFNMLALYFFGPRLEERLGSRAFLGLYLTSGIVGALLSFFFSPMAAVIGASGAVFGVQLGFARYWPRERILIWGVFPVEARVLVIVMTLLALFGGFGGARDGVAHFAHLGGFLGGWIFLKLWELRSPARKFKKRAAAVETDRAWSDAADLRRWEGIRREELHAVNREEVDRLLAKVRATGARSLTPDERAALNRFSQG
jgi:membrane associated rhomboid family serine protease